MLKNDKATTRVVYFQPAQTTFSDTAPLNVLLVADSEAAGSCVFRFYGSVGSGCKELFAQEKAVEKGHTHLYFQLPARCFGAQLWGTTPEELTLLASVQEPEGAGGVLLFREEP